MNRLPQHPDSVTGSLQLDPAHRELLAEAMSDFRLGWVSPWRDAANTEIGPALGLPELPVARANGPDKSRAILALVGDEPFVWIDDEPADAAVQRLDRGHPAHLVISALTGRGLTREHLDAARVWAQGI